MGASMEWSARTRHQEESLPLRGTACVIEHDDADRAGVSSLLRHMGFATHETGAGVLGALIADQIHVSVIVVNVMIEDVRGLKLIQQLRETSPSAVIIALTPDPRALTLAHVAGADAVLASPPCGEALCATITEALRLDHGDVGASSAKFEEAPRYASNAAPTLHCRGVSVRRATCRAGMNWNKARPGFLTRYRDAIVTFSWTVRMQGIGANGKRA